MPILSGGSAIVNPLANVQSVFARTGVVAATAGDYNGVVPTALTGATAATRYVGATVSGAPVAGTFAVGDLVIDQAGGAWTCTAAGTPGTWAPAVAAGSITNVHIAPGAAIQAAKIAAASGPSTLLSTTTLGSDGTFDVSGIDQSYSDLFFILIARGTRVAATDFLQMRLNNDSGANYDSFFVADAAGVFNTGGSSCRLSGWLASASATANFASFYEILIPGYTGTTWAKTGTSLNGAPVTLGSTQATETTSFVWNSTAAVNRVAFFGGTTANLKTGSVLRIYGR